jgi:integrase
LVGDEFGAGRDIGAIVVRRAGALVTTPEATVPYAVTDADGTEVDAFAGYLRHVTAGDFSGLSIRSYGLALLRWLRFLDAVYVAWDQAEQAEVRDFVLWMRQAAPGRRHPAGCPGSRKREPADRQRVPETAPRAIPDALFDELFAALGCDRDRAILALYVATGARPSELLGMRGADIDYGGQMIAVTRKGTRTVQWLPASPDAFVWLRLYQASLPAELAGPDQPVWWTRRRPWRALEYDAMRAVLRRVNDVLGTNWTLHDLRHTCAVRMEGRGVASDASFRGWREDGAVRAAGFRLVA